MTAHRPITPDLDAIAAPYAGYDEQPCFTGAEWRDAAQYYADTGDESELLSMPRRQAAYDRFVIWQRDGEYLGRREAERREFTDFGNWEAANG